MHINFQLKIYGWWGGVVKNNILIYIFHANLSSNFGRSDYEYNPKYGVQIADDQLNKKVDKA